MVEIKIDINTKITEKAERKRAKGAPSVKKNKDMFDVLSGKTQGWSDKDKTDLALLISKAQQIKLELQREDDKHQGAPRPPATVTRSSEEGWAPHRPAPENPRLSIAHNPQKHSFKGKQKRNAVFYTSDAPGDIPEAPDQESTYPEKKQPLRFSTKDEPEVKGGSHGITAFDRNEYKKMQKQIEAQAKRMAKLEAQLEKVKWREEVGTAPHIVPHEITGDALPVDAAIHPATGGPAFDRKEHLRAIKEQEKQARINAMSAPTGGSAPYENPYEITRTRPKGMSDAPIDLDGSTGAPYSRPRTSKPPSAQKRVGSAPYEKTYQDMGKAIPEDVTLGGGLLGGAGAPYTRTSAFDRIIDKKIKTNFERTIPKMTGALYTGMRGGATIDDPKRFFQTNAFRAVAQMGPYGALVAAAVTSAIAVPKLVEEFIRIAATKGTSQNMDWRRSIENEVNGIMDIEEKKKRLLGIDTYVVTQTDTYDPESGSTTYNSAMNRQEIIVSKKIGLVEKAVGIE